MRATLAAQAVVVSIFTVALSFPAVADGGPPPFDDGFHGPKIRSIVHAVPHVSSVPANAGEEVVLYVRERVADFSKDGRFSKDDHRDSKKGDHRDVKKDWSNEKNDQNAKWGKGEIVLFVHGGTVPSVPDYDLQYENYSWAEYLARHGFDVFMMDQSGYGFSPRPEMDDPCNVNPDDQELLVPNPLDEPCELNYPYNLTTNQSDWDEINTVVDYILDLRGGHRVHLAGWSAGVTRVAGYSLQHPEKVKSLYLYAGAAGETQPTDPPPEVPAPGYPMNLQTHEELMQGRWDSEVGCEDQFDPEIRPVVWNTIMSFDPLGSTWGTPPWNPVASPDGGVMRTRTSTAWGWNAEIAAMVRTPALVIVGEFDGVREGSRRLYETISSKRKVFIEVACASHFLVWENQHKILLETSKEWFRKGSIEGARHGTFWVDAEGRIFPQ